MADRLKRSARLWLLKQLVKKRPPAQFDITNAENDYVSIEVDDGQGKFAVIGVDGDEIVARTWPNGGQPVDSRVPFDDFLARAFRIRVFKGSAYSKQQSFWRAYRDTYLWGLDWFLWRRRRYTANLRHYVGRMVVLSQAVELRERKMRENGWVGDELSVSDLAKDIYGEMLGSSEKIVEYTDNVGMKLASFAQTGEITTADPLNRVRRFAVTSMAYAALAEYSATERRHKSNLVVQALLVAATFALALALASVAQLVVILRSP